MQAERSKLTPLVNHVRAKLRTVFFKAKKAGIWMGANPITETEPRRVPKRIHPTLKRRRSHSAQIGYPAPMAKKAKVFGEPPLDEKNYRLDELLQKGSHAEYLYDFGDGWRHKIVVAGEEAANRGAMKAECLAGARACPPEDSGGAYGYLELLKALEDPTNKRHRELLEWVGPHFAPEEFDLLSINRALRGAGSVRWRQRRERLYSS